ncbi:phage tail protein [Paenibacillus xylanexedens]|uniref:phage tail protein n=1 Tax=Paenibacillus xylanexedens TaxID=528191 RepID=UPI0021B57A2E|nr:phage tail protein [Paenibacillus xylanexedens]
MPIETNRLKLPLPLGNEGVSRVGINAIFEKIDEGVATREDLEELRQLVDEIDVPDASLTEKGVVQLSNATGSDSEKEAATPKAVKAISVVANAANLKAEQAFQAGNERKQQAVDALIALGVSASTSDSWDTIFLKQKTIKNAANVVIVEHIIGVDQSDAEYTRIIDLPAGYTPIAWSGAAVFRQYPNGQMYYTSHDMKSAKNLTPYLYCSGTNRDVSVTGTISKTGSIYRVTYKIKGSLSGGAVDLSGGSFIPRIYWTCSV